MKKILLTLLLALPFCMVAKAQDFRVGITGGYNLSSPSGYKSQSGFHVGVKGELCLCHSRKRVEYHPSVVPHQTYYELIQNKKKI